MQCNGDCFNCKFKDCIATYQEISKLDYLERKKKREEMEVKNLERKDKCETKINSERAKGT